MKKKVLLVLLVVLMVGILALSVFACNGGKEPTKNPDSGKKPTTEEEDDLGVSVDAGPMLNDLIDSINNTIKVVNTIEDKASVNAELYVDVVITDDKGAETAYNVDLRIAGSLDKGTKANNWALVTANVLDTVEIGLFAEVTSQGKEYLYLGQNILNEEFTWSKLSQAEDAELVQDKVINAVFDLVAGLEDAKFAADDETFKGADVSDTIDSGLLNKIGIINTIKGLGGTIGGLLFAPIEGINTVVDNETDLTSANGYAARLNIEELSGVISGVMPMLGGLLGDVDLSAYQGIVDMVVPLILGGNLNLTTLTFTPIEGAIPDIRLLVDINSDDTFGGVHLSYESEKNGIYVGFGLDNITFTNKSSKASSNAPAGVKDAEELAINIGLDVELESIVGGYANFDLNVYPNLSLGFDEDGYLALDLSKLYAEVVMTREVEVGYDSVKEEPIMGPESAVIAQYNADGQEDLIIDLYTIGAAVNGYGRFYRVPVNLSEKYADFIESEKNKGAVEEEVEVENAGLVDDVIGIVEALTAENADIVGVIMDAAGKIGTIIDEVSALAKFVTFENDVATIDVEALIANLIAEDGLIGESEKTIYIGEMEIVLGDIAKEITTDKVLGSIANLAGIEVQDVIGLVYDFTGATLDAEDAYANMELSATGFWQNGIGAALTAVLGGDDATAEIKLAANVSIIENKTEYTNAFAYYSFDDCFAIIDGKVEKVSYNTGNDGAKLLLNEVKKLFNGIVEDEKFELATFEVEWAVQATNITDTETGLGNAPVVVIDGTYVVPAIEFGTYYRINDLAAGTQVDVTADLGVAQVIFYASNPRMMGPMFIDEATITDDVTSASCVVPEGADHIIIQVVPAEGVENAIATFATTVPGSTGSLPVALALTDGSATLDLVAGGDAVYYYIDMESAGTITLTVAEDASCQVGIAAEHPMWGWAIMDGQLVGDNYGTVVTTYAHEVAEAGRVIICASPNWMNDDTVTISVAYNG